MTTFGVIGGSGLYAMDGLEDLRELHVDTPFGPPSDQIIAGKLSDVDVYFLPRHGKKHTILPSEINHRANIYALKTLGIDALVSVTAVGSLQERYKPCDIVVVDQFYDRTRNSRQHTFFGDGIAAHVPFADPTCPGLGQALMDSAIQTAGEGVQIHKGGTYVNIEGPAFSTRAESMHYKEAGFDVVGMTCLAEAKLAREAQVCFGALAMITDYDCWRENTESVTVDMVVANAKANTQLAQKILQHLVKNMPHPSAACDCRRALRGAIMTASDALTDEVKTRLSAIIGRAI